VIKQVQGKFSLDIKTTKVI